MSEPTMPSDEMNAQRHGDSLSGDFPNVFVFRGIQYSPVPGINTKLTLQKHLTLFTQKRAQNIQC